MCPPRLRVRRGIPQGVPHFFNFTIELTISL